MATMYIMGIATCLIGAIPTYDQIGFWAPVILTILRIAQGFAIGGEWGGAVLLSVEYAPHDRRGFFGSFPQMGLGLGLFLGAGAFTGLSVLMSEAAFLSWGWRLAFFVSIFLVVVGVYLRSRIEETPSFRAAQVELEEIQHPMPLKQLVADRVSRRHLLLGMGTRYAEGVPYSVWAVFIIAYATSELGFERIEVLSSLMVASLFLIVMIPVWGRISDTVPRRLVYGGGAVGLAAFVFPGFWIMQSGSWWALTAVLVVALGILYPMFYGSMAAFYAELFPPLTRYSGISVVYQLSGIFSVGITPIVLTWLMDEHHLAAALGYVVFASVVTLACLAAIRSRDLESVAEREHHRVAH